MANIMILAETGFGKTTSGAGNEKLNIMGLNPATTFWVTSTRKQIGSNLKWKLMPNFSVNTTPADLKAAGANWVHAKTPAEAAHAITLAGNVKSPFTEIITDDTNYFMQDMYMEKALSSGWDAPKMIGFQFNKIFKAIEGVDPSKNFIMMAHGEEYDKIGGKKGYRMKTTGKMVQEYITPEGKFDLLLIGISQWDDVNQKTKKVFVTKDDGVYTSAKDQGVFDELYVPNDLGYVMAHVNHHFNGIALPEWAVPPSATTEQTEA